MVVILTYCFVIPLAFTLIVLKCHDEDDEWLLVDFMSAFTVSIFWLPCIIYTFLYWLIVKIKSNAKKRNKKS
jgi:hypothetical protein